VSALARQLEHLDDARLQGCGEPPREASLLCRAAHGKQHAIVPAARELRDDLVLGAKLQVHAADPDAGLARNVADRGLRRPIVPKQLLCRLQDLGATLGIAIFSGNLPHGWRPRAVKLCENASPV
jgi:hypothetical protein